jgi:hypothetical protein
MLQLGFVLESDLLRPSVYRALWTGGGQMKAARVLRFGPPSVITNDDLPQPEPRGGELQVRDIGRIEGVLGPGGTEPLSARARPPGEESTTRSLPPYTETIGPGKREHSRTLMPVWVHLENLG